MEKINIINYYSKIIDEKKITQSLTKEKITQINGLIGSIKSIIFSASFLKFNKNFIFINSNKDDAISFINDLKELIPKENIFFFPESSNQNIDDKNYSMNLSTRSKILSELTITQSKKIIVTYPKAILNKLISKKLIKKSELNLDINTEVKLNYLQNYLFDNGYEINEFVTKPGDFSIRGGIFDIFSFSMKNPFRIEFSDDKIESIRLFDINTQYSISKVNEIKIISNFDNVKFQKDDSLLEYFSSESSIWFDDIDYSLDFLKNESAKSNEYINYEIFNLNLKKFNLVNLSNSNKLNTPNFIFRTNSQPSFNKKIELISKEIHEKTKLGFEVFLVFSAQKQLYKVSNILKENYKNLKFNSILLNLNKGFIDSENKKIFYTDHELFNRYKRSNLKFNKISIKEDIINEISSLNVGDYITHMDHGIGKYAGLQKINIQGKKQEAVKIYYKNNDILYISIHSLHKINKYQSKDGTVPKIHQLGSSSWTKTKLKAKTKIKTIAFDLIKLYAKRKLKKGFTFSKDTYLQEELEASFIFEDTPDQITTNKEVKKDMESDYPMDRLICGDVGFGKTEIAIRAAFKAVCDEKQVAILVPTTILSMQHFNTFKSRLKNFPCNIDYINRFKTIKEKVKSLDNIRNGNTDILIGTHRIVSKDISFKNLGLLIIDEEQKFGVSVKDKLKTFKENVDTLTLTATPIPRTLQFSLMSARDLSIIKTPPPNRVPIHTENIIFDSDIIKEKIENEISREGQIFFIHNRIENINKIRILLENLIPNVSVKICHGKMDGKILEKILLDFMNKKFEILVSTTIIENGLDIPNANTILINNAQNFGISDLHQMRGRVGRSNIKGFCFLITPPKVLMTDEARKRILALEDYDQLGSGFNIAMKDLEIRGAGNILGPEQSGFIADIGFDMYQKILNEAIIELKEEEFKNDLNKINSNSFLYDECLVETDLEIHIPDDYVKSIDERLKLYKQINKIKNIDMINEFKLNLKDRFGQIPNSTLKLLDSIKLKWIGNKIGLKKISLKFNRLILHFPANYDNSNLNLILKLINTNSIDCEVKEKNTKLVIVFINIFEITKAINKLKIFDEKLN